MARLAGVEPAAVIVEVLNDDGTMARRPDLEVFAEQHNLKIGTIADLIQYRIKHENTLERISECAYPTEFGEFRLYAYQDRNDDNVHLALVMGNVAGDEPVLARVHARNLIDDLFFSQRSDCSLPVREAMKKIAEAGCGVLVIIRQKEDNKALVELIHAYQMQDQGIKTQHDLTADADWRTTGTGSRILSDLGVRRLKVMGAQKKYIGLSGFDLEVVEHIDTVH